MKLIIGPPNSGKTQRAIELLADWTRRRQSRAVLIVPSDEWAEIARVRLANSLGLAELPPTLGNSIITFSRFYFRVLHRTGKSLRLVAGSEREALIRDSLFGLARQGRLAYFADVVEKPGLVISLVRFIGELSVSGISSNEYLRFARGPKDVDIARVFERYTMSLELMGATDVELAGQAALAALDARRIRRPFGFVAADQFDSYTQVQVRLLSAIARNGSEVVATLDYEEGLPVHLWHEPTMKRFNSAGATIEKLHREPVGALEIAARRLMSDNDSASKTNRDADEPAVVILSAPDRAAEIRAVAREIKRALNRCSENAPETVRPSDIAIISRSKS
ncbi:MAG TPA: hypothetical protein VFV34_28075, partial [Blastocatellia bacterium]|nr:hypothetical protein [Blastocatellia bacterium]